MFKNTIIYTIGTMLPKLIVFVMLPIYMNYLTPEEYGLIQTINALVSVLSIFYLTSLRTSITRSYIDYDSNNEKQGFVFSVFIFLVLFSIVLSAVLLNLENIITPYIFNNIPSDPYFRYMVILSFLTIFPIIPLTMLRIREQALKFVLFNGLETLLIVILTVYLLVIKDMGAIGSLKAIIFARLFMGIIYFVYVLNFTKLKFKETRIVYVTSSLALAIPLVPHFLAGWINSVGDRVLIEQYLNLFELGIYSLGAQFNVGLMMLVTSFNMAYAPRFYKMMKNGEVSQKVYSKIFNVAVLIVLMMSFVGLIIIPVFIKYFGSSTYQSSYLFIWLLFGGTIWHLGYIMSVSSLVYFKKMKRVALVTLITAGINIVLNLILIPVLGIFGAAVATYLSYYIQFYYVKRLADKMTKDKFIVDAKVLYIGQIILLANLTFVWTMDNYIIPTFTLIVSSGAVLARYTTKLYSLSKTPKL
ncbi:MAG: oligosaccharide flippase family protein [Bacillota bacterium]